MPRIRALVRGVVQGVGFRPFVYLQARNRGLRGWVLNRPDGVVLEAEGDREGLDGMLEALRKDAPPAARVLSVQTEELPEAGDPDFRILPSADGEDARPSVPADLAMCPACARELDDPRDRRHRYPFTNCTQCGPRFTIIESLPYDRPRTSMKGFPLCPRCGAEYRDPADRRFHAQPVACPHCGPRLELLDCAGASLARDEAALEGAAALLLEGGILALKGLGGFQLMADATSPRAVRRLRERKRREEKPFAVMFPDLSALEGLCRVAPAERALLASPQAPILLMERNGAPGVAAEVAPGNPRLGALLPTTPLHHLLLERVARALVCTSGNLTEEPLCHRDVDALERLGGVADRFLVHDRPILRPVDDSVARVDAHGMTLLRRARGFAPQPHPVALGTRPVLAFGAHQKSTICLLDRGQAVVSQHLGDLHTADGVELLERTVEDFLRFFQVRPARLACDLHPDYASTRLAERISERLGVPLVRVQHHHAHVAAVAAEVGTGFPAFGLAWDGTGLGTDGTLWGGEAIRVEGGAFRRCAHLLPFPLPGGERAVRDPARCALGLLWGTRGDLAGGDGLVTPEEAQVLRGMLERRVQCPTTSSVGRLFDAVAALLGVRSRPGFEGQAAMDLEYAAQRSEDRGTYPWAFRGGEPLVADPAPLVTALLADRTDGVPVPDCARRFHRALADLALVMARQGGSRQVLLAGGCFQNALLTFLVRGRLEDEGFQPVSPEVFPPNDGAVSLGQATVAALA